MSTVSAKYTMSFFRGKSERWLNAFDFFRKQKFYYMQTFGTAEGKAVLKHLAKFCRANEDTIGATDAQTYVAIGRREVWLYIQKRLTLSPEELTDLIAGPDTKEPENG